LEVIAVSVNRTAWIVEEVFLDRVKEANLHTKRGEILEEHGKSKQALAEFRYATALDPENALAHYGYARILHYRLRQLDEADRAYRRCLAVAENYDAMADYANLLEQTGHLDVAREMKKRSSKIILKPFIRPRVVQSLFPLLVFLPWFWTRWWYLGLLGMLTSSVSLYRAIEMSSIRLEITPEHIVTVDLVPFPLNMWHPRIRRYIVWSEVNSVHIESKKVLKISAENEDIVLPLDMFKSSAIQTILNNIRLYASDARLDLDEVMPARWPPRSWE
jgi:tetratricopeptide (TPR) repeat protein